MICNNDIYILLEHCLLVICGTCLQSVTRQHSSYVVGSAGMRKGARECGQPSRWRGKGQGANNCALMRGTMDFVYCFSGL
jgi:hypothetical protein